MQDLCVTAILSIAENFILVCVLFRFHLFISVILT